MVRKASPDTQRIVTAYGSQMEQVRALTQRFITRAWDTLGNYRDADIARFASLAVPAVIAGQRQTVALTDAYLANLATEILGQSVRPAGIRPDRVTGAAVRGVDPTDVYTRPGRTVWTALSLGKTLEQAISEGRTRALSLAMTDLQLAKTHATRSVFSRDGRVVGFRRVLTGREDCGLCVVASTQRYHKEDLMPIHPGCDCGVEPIYGSEDPGQVIDPDTLAQAHGAIAERFGADAVDAGARVQDYRKVLLVQEHGELGPMLTVKGQTFTGPAEI